MKSANIAIIGAGLGGLTAAALLLRAGHRVRVYEQAPEIAEVGAGISLPPNASKVLTQLGLADALKSFSNLPREGRIINGATGEPIKVMPFGEAMKDRYGDYYYQAHRADLHELLLDTVRREDPDCVCVDHQFSDYREADDGVEIEFENQDRAHADIVIGADGVRSTLRSKLHGAESPRFTGYIVWRAIVPMESLPAIYGEPCSNVWVGPARNFTFYPLRGRSLLNCVMFAGDSDWKEEGWNIPAKVREIREAFAGYHDSVQRIIDVIPESECYKWALYDREPIAQWAKGRAVLMGDAAHPMLPFLGQGASMAIEDASILSDAISAASSVEGAFAEYERIRRDRANWVVLESREAGARFGSETPTPETFSADRAMRADQLYRFEPPALS